MINDIDKYVDFLTTNSINEHQFLILWLVHTKDLANISKYKAKFGNFNVGDINDLIDRHWIDDFGLIKNDQRTFNIYDFIVTDKFTKIVLIDEEDAYEELVQAYPKWLSIKGVKFPTLTGDPYKLAKEYQKYIKRNRLAHERVIRITTEYFKNKEPQVGIEKYILNRLWNLLEDEIGPSRDAFSYT